MQLVIVLTTILNSGGDIMSVIQEHDCIMYERMREVEIKSTSMDERLISLCEKITNQTIATWGLFTAILLLIIGVYFKQ